MSEKSIPLDELNRMVLFSGRITQMHIKNLQNFPYVFFNDLKKAKIDYDIATKKGGITTFSYDLDLPLEANDHLEERYKALEKAVRDLFWKEAKINIKVNGKEVYKSG